MESCAQWHELSLLSVWVSLTRATRGGLRTSAQLISPSVKVSWSLTTSSMENPWEQAQIGIGYLKRYCQQRHLSYLCGLGYDWCDWCLMNFCFWKHTAECGMEMLEERAGCKYSKGVGICWGHYGCRQRLMLGPWSWSFIGSGEIRIFIYACSCCSAAFILKALLFPCSLLFVFIELDC